MVGAVGSRLSQLLTAALLVGGGLDLVVGHGSGPVMARGLSPFGILLILVGEAVGHG